MEEEIKPEMKGRFITLGSARDMAVTPMSMRGRPRRVTRVVFTLGGGVNNKINHVRKVDRTG